jgi:hypothetical protein
MIYKAENCQQQYQSHRCFQHPQTPHDLARYEEELDDEAHAELRLSKNKGLNMYIALQSTFFAL